MIFSSHVDILVHSLLSPWFLWHSILLILLWPIFSLHLCCFFGRIIDLYLCLITQLCLTLGLLCPWDFFRQEYWSELPFPSSRGSSRPRDQGSNLYLCVSCSAGRFFIPWAIWGMTQHSFYSSPTELFLLHLCWFFRRIVSLYSVCIIWSLSPLCFSFFAFKESHSSPRLQLLRLQMPMVRASYANVLTPEFFAPHLQNHPIHYPVLSTSPAKLLLSPFLHYLCYHFLEHLSPLAPYSCSSLNLFKGQMWSCNFHA